MKHPGEIGAGLILAVSMALAPAALADDVIRTGVAPDGTHWSVESPASWNGTLLIYSRGGAPRPGNPLLLAPKDSAPTLLAHGYALSGTAYTSPGWNPLANARGQFAALPGIEAAIGRKPKHVINVGTSYGGLVGAMEVDRSKGEIDGSVLGCGLIVGGIDLLNAQLDGEHAINQLLTPHHDIKLVHLADKAGIGASSAALQAAVAAAAATPDGRARLALAAALMHIPAWRDGDKPAESNIDAQAAQQVAWLKNGIGAGGGIFGFMQGSRLDVETQADGNPSSNRGADYAGLLKANKYRPIVEALYRKAGLDLDADLKTLSRSADIVADPAALAWMKSTSLPSYHVPVPVLAMQTSGDPVAPRSVVVAYAQRARAAGSAGMVQTAMVDRPGHCTFQPNEILAAVDAMSARLASGTWGKVATPAALQQNAGTDFVAPPSAPFAAH